MLALLMIVVARVALVGRTTTVMVCCAPLPIVPRLQISVSLPGPVVVPIVGVVEQLPAEGEADIKVTSAGNTSVTVMFAAELRPLAILRAVTT